MNHHSEDANPTPGGEETPVQGTAQTTADEDRPRGTPSAPYPFDLAGLDAGSREMLRTMYRRGGEATTSTLREEAALSRNQVNYRYRKLRERDLVETWKARPADGSQKQTHARLTDLARDAIGDGLLDDITDAHTNLRQVRADLTTLEDRLDGLPGRWVFNALENDVETVRENQRELYDELEAVREEIGNLAERVGTLDRKVETADGAAAGERDAIVANRAAVYRLALLLDEATSLDVPGLEHIADGEAGQFEEDRVFDWRGEDLVAQIVQYDRPDEEDLHDLPRGEEGR
jgi:hypothetical protein